MSELLALLIEQMEVPPPGTNASLGLIPGGIALRGVEANDVRRMRCATGATRRCPSKV